MTVILIQKNGPYLNLNFFSNFPTLHLLNLCVVKTTFTKQYNHVPKCHKYVGTTKYFN